MVLTASLCSAKYKIKKDIYCLMEGSAYMDLFKSWSMAILITKNLILYQVYVLVKEYKNIFESKLYTLRIDL